MHKGRLLGVHLQTTLMDGGDPLVLQVICQDSAFHLQTSFVVHLHVGGLLMNRGKDRLKNLKDTEDQQCSSLVGQEVHHRGITTRRLLVNHHDIAITKTTLAMLDPYVGLCFQHLLMVSSQCRPV